MANMENLITPEELNSRRTPEQHSEDSRKGGHASGEARRKRKALRDSMNILLGMQPSAKEFNKLVEAGFEPEEIDNSLLVTLALFNSAKKGDVKAIKELRNLIGEDKPDSDAEYTKVDELIASIDDKQAIKYNTNCVNSTIAYEMRCRGYKVVAGKSNSVLRDKPELAWEDVTPITFDKVALDEIEQQMKEWGNGARACVCFKNTSENSGHAIIAENINGKIDFLDVQRSRYYNKKEADREKYDHTAFFRIDGATISNRGVNACEKE